MMSSASLGFACWPPEVSSCSAPGPTPGFPRLLGDIGGTNARFALVDGPGEAPRHVRSLRVADHAGPVAAVEAYLAALGQDKIAHAPPRAAALALATPIDGDQVTMTNSRWRFSRSAVRAELGLDVLLLLNDFEALALSLPGLGSGQIRTDEARAPRGNVMAVVGPGTGLGVAGVLHTPAGWVAVPGEGGHATLAPMDERESALLACVRHYVPHVSAERLLSGIGLPVLYRAVAQVDGLYADVLQADDIVARAIADADPLCTATLDSFCSLLGNFAGNVALTLGARAGVFVGGGIVPRLGEGFFASRFRARFEAKGRFQAYLEQIPTYVITDTLAALGGAAYALERANQMGKTV
ncbi:glucokinase [Telluria mixta]|uniref:Glucokinase n=1 Tax=Telluria mixta TaxID=34071 RepID=A0ABT2C186_9BURK|nr:glucokinase [Telluria mixta]MCS0631150.1 glucokinase [Telluria mixta]WEM95688.1 glucokinase [Telluria mixta]